MSNFIKKSTGKELIKFFEMDENYVASNKMQPILALHLMGGESQTDKGYKGNTGIDRVVNKKTGRIDYGEISELWHAGKW